MSCGVSCRCGSDEAFLWLWCRLAATAPIGPLVWEPPYSVGVALKRKKNLKTFRFKNNKHYYDDDDIMCIVFANSCKHAYIKFSIMFLQKLHLKFHEFILIAI